FRSWEARSRLARGSQPEAPSPPTRFQTARVEPRQGRSQSRSPRCRRGSPARDPRAHLCGSSKVMINRLTLRIATALAAVVASMATPALAATPERNVYYTYDAEGHQLSA